VRLATDSCEEDGGDVAFGEEGMLWVHGPSACAGYFGQREKSLATFHGPWTRTGDRYLRNEDGTYTYAGRADDMLKVGGVWVSPFEVESALQQHEAVLEAAVVGQPAWVEEGHPAARLQGSEALVAIWSKRYPGPPLRVQGPGAGAAVTAGGVIADVLRVAGR
jgi:acyl-coenzyme A synthetase/AMP-(fatty) acid ligase